MRRWAAVVVAMVLLLMVAGMGAAEVPPDPARIDEATGNFWINHTWYYETDVIWYLITGESEGEFQGFNWTGSAWQSDNKIVSGLGSVGYTSRPTTFQKNGVWYLIAGDYNGDFHGFNWTGSTWQSDSSIVSGLTYSVGYSAPTVFQKDGMWYLISGGRLGYFYGFNWTGSAWQSDLDIVGGLGDIGSDSTPTAFQKDETWYLISGDDDYGVFHGFNWTGSAWQSDSDIVSGLSSGGEDSAPTVFQKDETWYLISGEYDGIFNGFNWTGSAWQSDSDIIGGLGNIGWYSSPIVFGMSYDYIPANVDSHNVSVNGVWHNGTPAYYTDTYTPHAWQNITVYAYNSSGTGTLSTGNISQNTQIPNNPVTITNVSEQYGDENETVYVDCDATDADGDTLTFSCSRTDMFTDFDTATGKGSWTARYKRFYTEFGVSDGWGSTSTVTTYISGTEHDPYGWWNTSWKNRAAIEITNSGETDLNNFYVGVVLNTTKCAWADCRDIRLWDQANYVKCNWYTASFNDGLPVNQENEVVYVQVSHIPANNTTWIYYYFNNPDDVPSTCSGMGGMYYYEDFDDAPIPPPNPPNYYVKGWQQVGDKTQTGVTPDGYGGLCIWAKNNLNSQLWDICWENSYKLLVQPTATAASCEFWVEPAAPYDVISVIAGQWSPCGAATNLKWTTPGVWQLRSFNLDMRSQCKGRPSTMIFFINTKTALSTHFDNIYLNQTYPYDPELVYYGDESVPTNYIILYDGSRNLVNHAQVTLQNLDTGEIVYKWKDVADGIIGVDTTINTVRIAVRTFDGVFVYTHNFNTNPECEITIPIHYNVKIHPVDHADRPLFDVFCGLSEYTSLNPQAFWGMDLSDKGYVPITNCSGFPMCDIIAEKGGYEDYNVTALNWTTKSALIKDYRHTAVLVKES